MIAKTYIGEEDEQYNPYPGHTACRGGRVKRGAHHMDGEALYPTNSYRSCILLFDLHRVQPQFPGLGAHIYHVERTDLCPVLYDKGMAPEKESR